MKNVLPRSMKESGVDMVFAQINIFHDDVSVTYIVPYDGFAAQVIEAAFGESGVYDGTSYVFKPGMSRKRISSRG